MENLKELMPFDYNVEVITPNKAKELLQWKNDRPLSKVNKSHIVKGMNESKYMYASGDPIRVSSNGQLIDGVHRLESVVTTNKPGAFMVYRYTKEIPELFSYIDIGKNRNKPDILAIHKAPNFKDIAHIIGNLQALEKKWNTSVVLSNNETIEYYEKHKDELQDALKWASTLYVKTQFIYATGLAAAYIYFNRRGINIKNLLEALCEGRDIRVVNILRNWFVKHHNLTGRKPRTYDLCKKIDELFLKYKNI
jgi:hypothetical protein